MFKRNRSHVCSFKRLYESDLQIGARRHVRIGTLTVSVLSWPIIPKKDSISVPWHILANDKYSKSTAFGHGKDQLIYPSTNWKYMSHRDKNLSKNVPAAVNSLPPSGQLEAQVERKRRNPTGCELFACHVSKSAIHVETWVNKHYKIMHFEAVESRQHVSCTTRC